MSKTPGPDTTPGKGNNPASWLGLLKWSLTHTDGTQPSEVSEMSIEKREWLQRVMEELTYDEVERIKGVVESLKAVVDSSEPVNEDKLGEMEGMLEDLVDTVENIDNAKSFALVGGFPPLVKAMADKEQIGLASKAIEVLSALVQNHPYCQDEAMKFDVIPLLCSWIEQGVGPDTPTVLTKIAVKALSAVSSLVRGYKPGETYFKKKCGGIALLLRCISATLNPRMQRKALFMLRAVYLKDKPGTVLAATNGLPSKLEGQPRQPGLFEVLCKMCGSDDIDLRENAFAACDEMLGHFPNSLLHFNQQSPTLQDVASRRMKEIRDMEKDKREQFEEELKTCLTILMRCKKGLFHPTYEFQVVDPSLTLPGGLEVNMSFDDGKNKARIAESWKFSTKVQWSDGMSDFVAVPVSRHMKIMDLRQLFSDKLFAPVEKISMRTTATLEPLSDTDTVETSDLFNLGAVVNVSGSSVDYFKASEGPKSSNSPARPSDSIFQAGEATTNENLTGKGVRMSYLDKS